MKPEDIQDAIAGIDIADLYPHDKTQEIMAAMNLPWQPFITEDGKYDLSGRLATTLGLFTDEQLREIQATDDTEVVEEAIGVYYGLPPGEPAFAWMVRVENAFFGGLTPGAPGEAVVACLKAIRDH